MVAVLQKSQTRILNSVALSWPSGTNLKGSLSENFSESEPLFPGTVVELHHEPKISKLQHGFCGRIHIGGLDANNLPCWYAHFPAIVTSFFWSILYKFIFPEYHSTHQPPDTFLLIFLFEDGSSDLFWSHLGKTQRLFNILWRFPEAKTTTFHKISYWFTWCQMVSVLFLFFSFPSGALADVVLHCFFSKPSSLSPTLRDFFVKTIVTSSFSLLRGFSSFEKPHCNKKGWRFWRRWRRWWARE